MMMGYGWGGFGMVLVVLFWIMVFASAVWLIANVLPSARSGEGDASGGRPATGLEIAERRFARGELSKEEFQAIARTLRSGDSGAEFWSENGAMR